MVTDTLAPRWTVCTACRAVTYLPKLTRNMFVCPDCGHHRRLGAPERLAGLLDPGSLTPLGQPPPFRDPLGFVDTRPYAERHAEARLRTGLTEAVLCARGRVQGHPLVVAAMDFRFMGGSLSTGVGDLVVSAARTALAERQPLLLVAASGGARMQEGALSLMQMARTSAALAELDEAGVLTVSLITDPTYGGVAASFATLTDVLLAESGARLGFAGPRVIEQTIRQRLPDGFQTAEFLLGHGLVDLVVPRTSVRPTLGRLLAVASGAPQSGPPVAADPVVRDPRLLPERDPWEVVQLARHPKRPTTRDYIDYLVDGFQELHGDRVSGDCPAVVGGVGTLAGFPVVLIGTQKGHGTRELLATNFGMSTPDGYRKAARLMRLAAKLRLPVVTLVDTPGAYPGVDAEQGGQALVIAENLRLMSGLPVPVVAVISGEGGSGGALALAVADRVLMCANAVYSVISPEGCAAILWRDADAADRAALALGLEARALLRHGVVDGVVPEPVGGAHLDAAGAAELLRDALAHSLYELSGRSADQLVRDRRRRFDMVGSPAEDRFRES